MLKFDTPKKIINYYKWLEFNNLAICDGITETPYATINILYVVFIITGCFIFLRLLMYYGKIKGLIFKSDIDDN